MRKSKQQGVSIQNHVQTIRKQNQLGSHPYQSLSSFHKQIRSKYGKQKLIEVNSKTCSKAILNISKKSPNKSWPILTHSMVCMSNFISFGQMEGSQWKSESQSNFEHAQGSQPNMYQLRKFINQRWHMINEWDQHHDKP